jgi:thiol-activated cytolysin
MVAAALFAAMAGCSEDSSMAPEREGTVPPEEINAYVNDMPDWEVPPTDEEPPVDLGEAESLEDNQYYRCSTVEYDMKRNFDDIVAVGANATALKPGMLVQGKGVRNGSLSTIGLARAPISISVNLALENPARRIQSPSSSTIQEAVASLQREADDRLGNLDVVPAMINYRVSEAYSFSQAMMDAGISLKYSAVFASGSVKSSFSQNTSVKSHTVIVKLLQPMYTISFADDEIAEPAGFFAPDLSAADFDRQRNLGTMGPGNQPCYVQSVTYGRMLVYTATSTEVQSSSELRAALKASYGVWSGSGNITDKQRSVVRNSDVQVQVFGGTQQQATDAIKAAIQDGDFSAFLEPAPATTAVPLSYRINDMKNRQAAIIGDATKYTVETCEPVNFLRFTVSLDSIRVIDGCESEQDYDIEAWAYNGSESYWFIHNTGTRFTKEELESHSQNAVFTMEAGEEDFIQFFTGDYGNINTGRDSWSKDTYFYFPFDLDQNPHHFTHVETTFNNQYEDCKIEVFYSIQRELAD